MRFVAFIIVAAALTWGAAIFLAWNLDRTFHRQPVVPLAAAATEPVKPSPETKFLCPGNHIVYIVDTSGSMLNVFSTLRNHLSDAILHLHAGQSYNIIGTASEMQMAFAFMQDAIPAAALAARNFLYDNVLPRGDDTAFPNAFATAVAEQPDHIVFLTDGDFDPRNVPEIISRSGIPLNVAVFQLPTVSEGNIDRARTLAAKSKGGGLLIIPVKDIYGGAK